MEKPKLEDFGITQKNLDFCREVETNLEENISKIRLIIAIIGAGACFAFGGLTLINFENFNIFHYSKFLGIFLSLLYIFIILITVIPILPIVIGQLIYENKIIILISRKFILLNGGIKNNLKLVAKYRLIENEYKKALSPFLEEEWRLYRLEREKEEAERKKIQIEKKHKKDHWLALNGYSFEKEIELLFKKMGYKTNRTKGSGDGGVDIFVSKGGEKYIVQCKNHKKPVGPSIVRDLYGVLASEKADKAMLINSGGFTKGVRDFSRGKEIVLWDIDDILKWSTKYYQI